MKTVTLTLLETGGELIFNPDSFDYALPNPDSSGTLVVICGDEIVVRENIREIDDKLYESGIDDVVDFDYDNEAN